MTAAAPDHDIDALAGEYVIGTLDPTERRVVDAHRQQNAALDAAIKRWEDLFAPLAAAVAPIVPTEGLFDSIARRIRVEEPDAELRDPIGGKIVDPQPAPRVPPSDERRVIKLTRSLRVWKAATALVGTLAACLMIGIGLSGSAPSGSRVLVAVLQKDSGAPEFLVSVDLGTRAMTVRPIKTEVRADKSYQLWLVSDKFDKMPKSLGLVGEGTATTRRTLNSFDRNVVQDATYAVSLEPRGGSPKDIPTGPVLWTGRLVPATP